MVSRQLLRVMGKTLFNFNKRERDLLIQFLCNVTKDKHYDCTPAIIANLAQNKFMHVDCLDLLFIFENYGPDDIEITDIFSEQEFADITLKLQIRKAMGA